MEHPHDQYAFLFHAHLFVAIPHSPVANPESVLWRIESSQALDVSFPRDGQSLNRPFDPIRVSP